MFYNIKSREGQTFFEERIMNTDLLQYIIAAGAVLIVLLVAAIASLQIKIYKYRRKVYFIKRDRERCNELLYSTKDGYFCFIYPDQKVKDPQKNIVEKCSRRLSVMLNLKSGTASSFADVMDCLHKDEANRLKKYVSMLQQEGRSFEDILEIKGADRYMCVYGNRVHGVDNDLYCDVVWFRDVTAQKTKINELDKERSAVEKLLTQYEIMVDGVNYPLWIRDEKLQLLQVNKKYVELSGWKNKAEVLSKNIELNNNKGEAVGKILAAAAQKSKKQQKKNIKLVNTGELYNFEMHENPYFVGDSLDKIGTVGYLVDNTDYEKAKRNFKINQNTHLEILGVLGTAFAIFDDKTNLYFYNTAFKNLWELEADFLEKTPSYAQFLEVIREQRMLPPVPDFKIYKDEELSIFGSLWETKEDLLHLPDGRTIRRFRTPHPNGVIFAFEDVSDRLSTMRRLNDLVSMQQSILDNLNDSVIIFGANQRLKFYNRAYLKLWGMDYDRMKDEPKLDEIISYQKLFFSNVDNWDNFKNSMLTNIMQGRKFNLMRDDDVNLKVSPLIFYDGSIMLTYSVE